MLLTPAVFIVWSLLVLDRSALALTLPALAVSAQEGEKLEQTKLRLGFGLDPVYAPHIVAIEKGNYSPSLELAFRIARVFNLSVEEVFYVDIVEP